MKNILAGVDKKLKALCAYVKSSNFILFFWRRGLKRTRYQLKNMHCLRRSCWHFHLVPHATAEVARGSFVILVHIPQDVPSECLKLFSRPPAQLMILNFFFSPPPFPPPQHTALQLYKQVRHVSEVHAPLGDSAQLVESQK